MLPRLRKFFGVNPGAGGLGVSGRGIAGGPGGGINGNHGQDASGARRQASEDSCALASCPLNELLVLPAISDDYYAGVDVGVEQGEQAPQQAQQEKEQEGEYGHTDIVRHLVVIDTQRIASAADDGRICVWDRMTGNLLGVLRGHTGPITVLLLLEAQVLLSGSADKTVRVWSLETLGPLAHTASGPAAAAAGPASASLGRGGNSSVSVPIDSTDTISLGSGDAASLGYDFESDQRDGPSTPTPSSSLDSSTPAEQLTAERGLGRPGSSSSRRTGRTHRGGEDDDEAGGAGRRGKGSAQLSADVGVLQSEFGDKPPLSSAPSSSSGAKIRDTFRCLRVLEPRHQGSVKSIVSIVDFSSSFVTGANDGLLRVWSRQGDFLHAIDRQDDQNLNAMLSILGKKLVTATDSSELHVYSTDTRKLESRLAFHRESVRCLLRLSVGMFASASLDGSIVVWAADDLAPIRLLTQHFIDEQKRAVITSVRVLVQLSERYLAATIGNGFAVFDVLTGACVCDGSGAHDAECTALVSLYDGARIVSSGADATLRMWGFTTKQGEQPRAPRNKGGVCALDDLDRGFSWRSSPPPLSLADDLKLQQQRRAVLDQVLSPKPAAAPPSPNPKSTTPAATHAPVAPSELDGITRVFVGDDASKDPAKDPVLALIRPLASGSEHMRSPVLLGEMPGHSLGVEAAIGLGETSLASSGADRYVFVWKDGRAESDLRCHFAAESVKDHYQNCVEAAVQEYLESVMLSIEHEGVESAPPVARQLHF